MKKILFLVLVVCFIILTIFRVDANHLTFPLIGKTIIIDVGHGGLDQGASHQGIKEAELNLAISLLLKADLERFGAVVLMTREGNYDLSKPNAIHRKRSDFDNRIKLINNSDADIYLSIHLNYFSNSIYYGPQVFYTTNIKENEGLAKVIQEVLNNALNTERQVKILSNVHYMYNKLNIKGVLIEAGFLSNPAERLKLTDPNYQRELARIIVQGIIAYYS